MLRKLGIGLLILWVLVATLPNLVSGVYLLEALIYVFLLGGSPASSL